VSSSSTTTTTVVTIQQVVDEHRKLELSHMTRGDVALEEAIAFAEALMRDILPKKQQQQYSQPLMIL
jgi:DNA repair ATPase RecN